MPHQEPKDTNNKPQIFAIDFGTTNSLLAAAAPQKVWPQVPINPGASNPAILKSILYVADDHRWYFGDQAIDQYLDDPIHGRVFKSLKRFLPDRSFGATHILGQKTTLAALISKFLAEIRQRANQHFDMDISSVIMGCPALFSTNPDEHRLALERLEDAARQAGFTQIAFLPEPIAAAYKFQQQLQSEKLVLIADFGGGTSDFTVQKMSPQAFHPDDVLAIDGVPIAGDRYDGIIMKHNISPHFGTAATYQKPTATKPAKFPIGFAKMMCSPADLVMMSTQSALSHLAEVQRWITAPQDQKRLADLLLLVEDRLGYALFRQIESAKIGLTAQQAAPFHFEYVDIAIAETIGRPEFEDHSAHLTKEILGTLDNCLKLAGVTAKDIDIVCLTGGTSMLPAINQALADRFGAKLATSSAFDSVVQGLAARGQQLLND